MTKESDIASHRDSLSVGRLSRWANRPSITVSAVLIAIALGLTRSPLLQQLRPVGDFYIGLLQMCVLPFLLATIPLAVRSAMTSAAGHGIILSLLVWLAVTIAVTSAIGVAVPSFIFHISPPSEHTIATIGGLIGGSADRMEVEFALRTADAVHSAAGTEHGLLALIPTNIFNALSANDTVRVLVFAAVFGIAMAATERSSGSSIFGALRHIHDVCLLIFEWFNIFAPLGAIALIAPQIAMLGSDTYVVLSSFCIAFGVTSILLLGGAMIGLGAALRLSPAAALSSMLGPMMLGAATRNTLVCTPLALETMTDELHVRRGPCELYIPVGFAMLRFGTILYFSVATLFMGTLLGRTFGLGDIVLVAVLSIVASFATLGVTGIAALAPLASVLRPFGLSYELAAPLMIIVDPVANMIRVMMNVALNCLIPALAAGREPPTPALMPAE